MSEQDTTPETSQARQEWQVRLEITQPQFPKRQSERVYEAPVAAHHMEGLVMRALARVPEHFDIGEDTDGCPIIGFEVIYVLKLVDSDGRAHIIPCGDEQRVHWRGLLGWETLGEHEQRQRNGEGRVEQRLNRKTPTPLNMWVWHEGV